MENLWAIEHAAVISLVCLSMFIRSSIMLEYEDLGLHAEISFLSSTIPNFLGSLHLSRRMARPGFHLELERCFLSRMSWPSSKTGY